MSFRSGRSSPRLWQVIRAIALIGLDSASWITALAVATMLRYEFEFARIDLSGLLKGSDQISNIFLADQDVLYIPKAEFFYIMGEVKTPGSYAFNKKDITIIEAISMAGGFTPIAARNKTRIVRIEDGREKIYDVNVDAITKSGKMIQAVHIKPNDLIVVPESFF